MKNIFLLNLTVVAAITQGYAVERDSSEDIKTPHSPDVISPNELTSIPPAPSVVVPPLWVGTPPETIKRTPKEWAGYPSTSLCR